MKGSAASSTAKTSGDWQSEATDKTTTMNIGIPKEIKAQENRVSMIPSSVAELVKCGHRVIVQTGAGEGASYTDEQYKAVGAELVVDAAAVYAAAELIVKVKEPQASEVALLKPHHILFTYLHLAADLALTESLAAAGSTAIAYETIEVHRRLPLLEPMSEIAGRMSAIVGSYHLAKHRGGRGCLLGGVPGVAPGRVVVLGGGTAGVNAARVATGIGADVTILEVDFERMRFLDITLSGTNMVYSNEANLFECGNASVDGHQIAFSDTELDVQLLDARRAYGPR